MASVGEENPRSPLLRREDDEPLFPVLNREDTVEFLQPLSAAALVGMTTINVLSSVHGQDPTDSSVPHSALRKYLVSMPYTLFVIGFGGLALAMVATRRKPRLLGFAAAVLLVELLYIVLVGSLVTIGRSDASPLIVWPVTVVIMVAVVIVWSCMCNYPKCLRCGCCRNHDLEDGRGALQEDTPV